MLANRWRIARIAGIEIGVDPSWLPLAALVVWSLATGWFPAALPDLGQGALVAVSVVATAGLFASLIAHELSHALAARRFGLGTDRITLFLFGGVAELQGEPESAVSELWIALAGPAASLALAGAFALLAGLPAPDVARVALAYLAAANLVLAVFNLLPAFPLDGGRALRALLWRRSGDLALATRRASVPSAAVALLLMGLGTAQLFSGQVVGGLWLLLIGVFLMGAMRTTVQRMAWEAALEGRTVASIMTRDPVTAPPDLTLADLVETVLLRHGVSFVPVVEDGVPLGFVEATMLREVDRENWAGTQVGDILEPAGGVVVAPDLPTRALLDRIGREGRRKFLVLEDGALSGVVTLTDLMAQLRVAGEIGGAPSRALATP